MIDAARMIADLPDATPVAITIGTGSLTAGELRRAFIETQAKRLLTTSEASDLFGYSSSQWQKWAAAGELEDAYQDAEGGPWRLPYASCEAYARRRHDKGLRRRGVRGPWGAKSVPGQGLALVQDRSPAVAGPTDGHARPRGARLAEGRSADRHEGAR